MGRRVGKTIAVLVAGMCIGLVVGQVIGVTDADAAKKKTYTCLADAVRTDTTPIIRLYNAGSKDVTVKRTLLDETGSPAGPPGTFVVEAGETERFTGPDTNMSVARFESTGKLLVDGYLSFLGGATPDTWSFWQIKCT